jgi:hypothetical protein
MNSLHVTHVAGDRDGKEYAARLISEVVLKTAAIKMICALLWYLPHIHML